jgi:hypothetical protein
METLGTSLRLLRRGLRRGSQWLRYRCLDAPVLFGNSFPKSGTHLLTQVLAGFSRFGPVVNSGLPAVTMYSGITGVERPLETILGEINRLRSGDVGYGHLHALPKIEQALCRDGVAPYFIFRDPRDVAVSHVFYITEKEPDHIHHHYYAHVLSSFDERLKVSIEGRPELDFPFPNISARFEPFMPWLDKPEVLSFRFEEFITRKGETIGKVLDHAVVRGFRYHGEREKAIELLSSSIDPQRSPTFRSGKVGGWKDYFTVEHKRLFKQVAGDLLVELGYESDLDW